MQTQYQHQTVFWSLTSPSPPPPPPPPPPAHTLHLMEINETVPIGRLAGALVLIIQLGNSPFVSLCYVTNILTNKNDFRVVIHRFLSTRKVCGLRLSVCGFFPQFKISIHKFNKMKLSSDEAPDVEDNIGRNQVNYSSEEMTKLSTKSKGKRS